MRDILVKEEDVVQNLSEIVKKAKEFFLVEEKSGKILFRNFSKLKNHQKIREDTLKTVQAKTFGLNFFFII